MESSSGFGEGYHDLSVVGRRGMRWENAGAGHHRRDRRIPGIVADHAARTRTVVDASGSTVGSASVVVLASVCAIGHRSGP